MPSATITSKGQITIPIEVRKALKLKAGDKIDFFEETDGRFILQPKSGSIRELRGILKKMGLVPDGPALSIEKMDRSIQEYAAKLDRATMSNAKQNSDATDVL